MDLQKRLIAPCAQFIAETEEAVPDIPALFRRLLLFETYIIQTIRFREFVHLGRVLGADNLVRLLDSGALKLQLDPTAIFQSGQSKDFPGIREKPPLPLLSFAFSFMRARDYNLYLVHNLQDVRRALYGYVSQADLLKLESAILRALLPVPEDSGFAAIKGHEADLRSNSPVLKKALAMRLRKDRGIEVWESELTLKIIPIDETDHRTESNLDRFGLNVEEAHKTLESALLAVAGLNSRIEDMKSYNALSGFIDDELPLFGGKFDFLTATLSPGDQEKTFDRVVKVRELPSFDLSPPDRSFDIERFLEIRSSKECSEFRAWLRTMKDATNEEIAERVNTVRAKLGPLYHGKTGKGVRIAISTAIGLIPVLGNVVGTVLSVIDSFILDEVFAVSGPTLFLSRQYPSLFERKERHSSEE